MTLRVYTTGEVLTAANLNASVNPLIAIKTATETVNNSTTIQDDDELFVTPSTNATYWVQTLVLYDSVSTTPNIKIAFSFAAGATFTYGGMGMTTANANFDTGAGDGYLRFPAATSGGRRTYGTMASELGAMPNGILIMDSTAGTFRLRWAQDTATAENTQVKAKSYIWARRIA